MSYNGWTNYETWAVKLWLDNDHGTYLMIEEMAQECARDAPQDPNVPEIWTAEQAAKFNLADRLKDWHEETRPEIDGVWSDLLGAALSEVNWEEIAENVLSDSDAFPIGDDDDDSDDDDDDDSEEAPAYAISEDADGVWLRELSTGELCGPYATREQAIADREEG